MVTPSFRITYGTSVAFFSEVVGMVVSYPYPTAPTQPPRRPAQEGGSSLPASSAASASSLVWWTAPSACSAGPYTV